MTRILTATANVVSGDATVEVVGLVLSPTNCPVDAQVVLGGASYFVASLTDSTHLELTRTYDGADDTVACEIYPLTSAEIQTATLNARTATLNSALGELDATGIQPNAVGTFAMRDERDGEYQGYVYLSLDGDGADIDTGVLFAKNSGTSADWSDPVPVTGAKGDSGLIGIWRGPWVTATAYAVDDAVSQGGGSYICVTAHTSGTFATDLAASKWQVVAAKGDTGATGATGAPGTDGTDGADGADGTGTGDVVGPSSAVNNNLAAFDTTTGKLIKDSGSKAADFQPVDSDLTAIAALTTTSFGRSFLALADAAAARTLAGLVIGTNVQAFDADTAKLDVTDQVLTGGVIPTSDSLGTVTTGTLTLNPGTGPQQHYTNNGAHTLAPGSNAGSILIDITNGASAGAITLSGWTKTVGTFATTNALKYRCHASIGNAGSLLSIQAMQ